MTKLMAFAWLALAAAVGCGEVDDNEPMEMRPDACATAWYADCDGDGVAGLGGEVATSCAEPAPSACGGGWTQTMPIAGADDCNDTRADIHPDATEVCDSADNNCNGSVDEDGLTTFYLDNDLDGHGDSTMAMTTCNAPAGYVTKSGDCDDTRADVFPGRAEDCDGRDNNCNSIVDEGVKLTWYRDADGDGAGNPAISTENCRQAAGWVGNSGDCNDASAAVHPGATEVCDTLDNNCNAMVDEGVKTTYYRDVDADGYGNATVTTQACTVPAGYRTNSTDCNDARADVYPGATEVCDSVDNNCNTTIDESATTTYYRDADGDGYGNVNQTQAACSAPAGYVADSTDCSDTANTVHPNAEELCFNAIDDDCDGAQNEAAQCSIDCNWSGARWLSHGYNEAGMTLVGAWASCVGGKLSFIDSVVTTPPGASILTASYQPKGTTDNVVGCDWSGDRWASQGYDGANAFSFGTELTCSGGRVTALNWENNLLAPGQIAVPVPGQLGCDWTGAIYLTHGHDSNCAFMTGFVVTCSNNHITNFEWVETTGCARTR